MGTRGVYGVVVDGDPKLIYNHFDSYPSGLGVEVVKEILELRETRGLDWVREKARALRGIDLHGKPEPEDVERWRDYWDRGVSEGDDWYALTRMAQGELTPYLELGDAPLDYGLSFVQDSLFCEWGYVIDLDNEVFEVYDGVETEPHSDGRFAKAEGVASSDGSRTYYPIRLVATFPLAELTPEALIAWATEYEAKQEAEYEAANG